ncbi:unnamed protein product [Danaus chrysippus]|uniref:(African queen) hypothetical protein n=1 Tax=Danaus chrysippus TaxID=151541 RepID=A0A8J2R6A5_9NEOP|nr:unnamed protein product [Danaus chrysippus]
MPRKSFISVELASHTWEMSMLSDSNDMTPFPFCFEDLEKELSHISPLIGRGEHYLCLMRRGNMPCAPNIFSELDF